MKPFSASHIEKWEQCKRRERFIYGLGIREPGSLAAEGGQAVHKVLEGGELTQVGSYPIAEMAARIAAASPVGILRHEFEFNELVDGLPFTGRIDAETADTVIDFKTTSKVKYVKTVRKLSKDIQRLLYVQVRPEAKKTLWLTGVWADLSVHPSKVVIDRPKDREKFKLHVLAPAEAIAALPEDTDPLSLEANERACDLYPPHGCPFKEKCFPPNKGMSVAMTSLIDELEAEQVIKATFDRPLTPEERRAMETAAVTNSVQFLPASLSSMPLTEEERAAAKRVDNQRKPIGVLYIDCFPIQLADAVTNANTLIGEAAQQVAADQQVHHALLVDFGKGGPMIAAQLAHNLRDKYYQHVTMETRSAEGKACVFKLMEMAETVIKAMI